LGRSATKKKVMEGDAVDQSDRSLEEYRSTVELVVTGSPIIRIGLALRGKFVENSRN
jgi:phospholipid N-methyltransferase